MSNKPELIFEKWKADLSKKDRSHKYVESNFDELFSTLHKSKIKFDDAYGYLSKAIAAHNPSRDAVKHTYRNLRGVLNGKTEAEFEKSWKENIDSAAKRVFYSLYPIDGEEKEEAQYGSMSASEYRKQRAYFDAMPKVDIAKLREDRKKMMEEFERMEKEQGGSDE